MRDDWPRWDADQAVAAFYHAHYRSLVRIAALLAGDGTQAEEIVQDAFVSVHRAWPHLRDSDEALGYLHRAVVTRARSRSALLPDPLSRPHGLAGAGRPAPGISGAVLVTALAGLPACQREALVLKYYADWPDPQIAVAMGIGRHALNAHARRGMSALRACLATAGAVLSDLPPGGRHLLEQAGQAAAEPGPSGPGTLAQIRNDGQPALGRSTS